MNNWLVRQAVASDGKSARTYAVAVGTRAVAYCCLAAGSIIRASIPRAEPRQNMPDQIPVVVIGRLAVDKRFERRGFGRGLLKDAILRALSASEEVGVRAIVVHAIDDRACEFYKKFGFLASPSNARTFILATETAKLAL